MFVRNKSAFTLIELLVVVLIIGILSAIALPQYRMAVEKSRIAEANILLRSITDSVARYIMNNGTLSIDNDIWDRFDISLDMPLASDYHTKQGKYFWYSVEDFGQSIFAGRGNYDNETDYFLIYQYHRENNPSSYDRLCRGDSIWGAKVCSSICGRKVETGVECTY